MTSCDDFLNQPTTDNYTADVYYSNDAACYTGANALYNMPWYDFQRGFIKVGEVMAGNVYWYGGDETQYWSGHVNASQQNITDMSYSLWTVNSYANSIYSKIQGAKDASTAVKNATMGECLTWKAMAYFFLVRAYGPVPIIHDNGKMIGEGVYNDQYKARVECVYEYIINTLEKAIELLPEKDGTNLGRIDKYAAEGLLAKVYLTKAGFDPETTTYAEGDNPYLVTTNHQRNADDLAKAAMYAKDVIDHSGRVLEPVYSDIFRGTYHGDESLIAWHWNGTGSNWTEQNSLQNDLALENFDETGKNWGGWNCPSVDLIEAFGEDPTRQTRVNIDDRRKGTLMMAGDEYDYFYTDCDEPFEIVKATYRGYKLDENGKAGLCNKGEWQPQTGAAHVKHLVGDRADHVKYVGYEFGSNMAYGHYTQLLRLADVYLIYAEAVIGNNGSTSDASAIDAFYAVRHRSIKTATRPASITLDDVLKERRLELACEGDSWYDYVRLYYYNPDKAIEILNNQKRCVYWGLDNLYKTWWGENGNYSGPFDPESSEVQYENTPGKHQSFDKTSFTLPFPTADVKMNPHLLEAPVKVDVSQFNY